MGNKKLYQDDDKRKFTDNFMFGVSTAAYQIEGAWNNTDKSESICDRFSHTPGKIADGSTGDVACDSYKHFKRDVEMIKSMGMNFYRFSISWTRLFPKGRKHPISENGWRYYNALIIELIDQGITPYVTLYHFDLPQLFQDKGGWENEDMVQYFMEYAGIVFDLYAEKVKHWVTFNEPARFCELGYGTGVDAPGVKKSGDAEYKCGYHVLLSHAVVYRIYKMRAKTDPDIYNGQIGIALNGDWFHPETGTMQDQDAADTFLQFETGWFAHPIFVNGDYPDKMLQKVGADRLPRLSISDKILLKGSADFYGLNHYTTSIAKAQGWNYPKPSRADDMGGTIYQSEKWPQGRSGWLRVVPWGFKNYLNWVSDQYNNTPIIIFENGYSGDDDINDDVRVSYLKHYINAVFEAMTAGANIIGYGVWSSMDNFEWGSGYTEKFGLYKVQFDDPNLERVPRKSAEFMTELSKTHELERIDLPKVKINSPVLI